MAGQPKRGGISCSAGLVLFMQSLAVVMILSASPAIAESGPARNAIVIPDPVAPSGPATMNFAFDPGPKAPVLLVTGPEGAVPGSVVYDGRTRTACFTPGVPFLPRTSYTVSMRGQPYTVSFTTGADYLVRPPDAAVPATLFGMHIHQPSLPGRWPSVPLRAWRLWDANVTWRDLEPARGRWFFGTLENHVRLARARNVELLLTLGKTPVWASARPGENSPQNEPGALAEPADMEDWKSYVRTVATRYKGRIQSFEIWNEPNTKEFFTGTVDRMVAMAGEAYRILKEIDPKTTVVSPSVTEAGGAPWLQLYLSQGGSRFSDVIGYHFYVFPAPPEAMVPLIRDVRRIMRDHGAEGKPLWNTESGWSKPKLFSSDAEASAYVARSYILNWASGVDRLYWYAWDNNNWVTLRMTEGEDNRAVTAAGIAYGELQKWIVGAAMVSCGPTVDGTWVVGLRRDRGYRAWVVWRPAGKAVFEIPGGWKVRQVRDLRGGRRDVAGSTIEIGDAPVLLE